MNPIEKKHYDKLWELLQVRKTTEQSCPDAIRVINEILSFIDTLEEPEERGNLQDAEVVFSGHALHTDVTKWADGYKLKIRIYDDN